MLGPAWTNLHAAAPRRAVSSAAPPSHHRPSTVYGSRGAHPTTTGGHDDQRPCISQHDSTRRAGTPHHRGARNRSRGRPERDVSGVRQEPDQEPGRGRGRGDHGRRRLRRGARLDERGGPVRRRLVHLPERVVLCPLGGPPKRGKNYFFGGTTTEAVSAKATIGKQTINLPAAAAGRKATLSGWLGNYVTQSDDAGACPVHRRERQGARDDPPRPRHDHLRPGHGLAEPERHRAARREAGHDHRDLQRGGRTTSSPARTIYRSWSHDHSTPGAWRRPSPRRHAPTNWRRPWVPGAAPLRPEGCARDEDVCVDPCDRVRDFGVGWLWRGLGVVV